MKESALLHLVMEWLTVKRIFAMRMNSGAMRIDKRFIRFGFPGVADILAFPQKKRAMYGGEWAMQITPTWLELKAGRNEQSDFQVLFQKTVEEEGHRYFVIRSLEDVETAFR